MKKKKLMIVPLLVVTAIAFGTVGAYAGSNSEKIQAYLGWGMGFKLDGKAWVAKNSEGKAIAPIIYEGTSYLPVRAIATAVGASVDWDEKNQTIIINREGTKTNINEPAKSNNGYKLVDDFGTNTTGNPENLDNDLIASIEEYEKAKHPSSILSDFEKTDFYINNDINTATFKFTAKKTITENGSTKEGKVSYTVVLHLGEDGESLVTSVEGGNL